MSKLTAVDRLLRAGVREYSRQQRLAVRAADQLAKDAIADERRSRVANDRARRQFAQNARERERIDKANYLADRKAEADLLNSDMLESVEALEGILLHTLNVNDAIDFSTLRDRVADQYSTSAQPDIRRHLQGLKRPGVVGRMLPWVVKSFETKLALAKDAARSELAAWHEQNEKDRFAFEQLASQAAERNREVDAFENDCRSGDSQALVSYFSMVLERSEYPEDFPQNFSVALQVESRMLVVRYELPPPSIVPSVDEYRYVQTRDAIDVKPRKATDLRRIYSEVIAGTVLRTVHEVLESDIWNHLDAVAVNGVVKAVDPATGRDIEPCLVSVRATREEFEQIDLGRVDKAVCLRNLGAQVSRSPDEIQPVKPVVEFRMSDPRFVDQSDLVSELSSAANLMDLNPFQFEELVANLFGKMGLESRLTRASRDGGVDCIAFDPRPVFGGKVVIQAKRYKNTVGVSAVRDLYGTMMNEGASKGLLVTTSGYGPDAFQFAKDKPIELIDGGGLLFLLHDIGVEAKIVMPDD